MDRASFELIGNVGKLEIKPISDGKKIAIIALATSERWKAGEEWIEKTHWHRIAVFAPNARRGKAGDRLGSELALIYKDWEPVGGVVSTTPEKVAGAQKRTRTSTVLPAAT